MCLFLLVFPSLVQFYDFAVVSAAQNTTKTFNLAVLDYYDSHQQLPDPFAQEETGVHWQKRLCVYFVKQQLAQRQCNEEDESKPINPNVFLVTDKTGTYAPSPSKLQLVNHGTIYGVMLVADLDGVLENSSQKDDCVVSIDELRHAAKSAPEKMIFTGHCDCTVRYVQCKNLEMLLEGIGEESIFD